MPTETKITLFDLPTARPDKRSISPYTSRVRYILNYKNLAYKTEWLELDAIGPRLSALGAPATTIWTGSKDHVDGSPRWTLPAIIDETDGSKPPSIISDSLNIIKYIETTYPDPDHPIFPSFPPGGGIAPAIHILADAYLNTAVYPVLRPFIFVPIYEIQTDESKLPWLKRAGGNLAALGPPGEPGSKERAAAWDKVRVAFETLSGFFDSNHGDDKWILGAHPTYFDFILLSALMMVRTCSADLWKDVSSWSGGKWGRYVDAAEPWLVIQ